MTTPSTAVPVVVDGATPIVLLAHGSPDPRSSTAVDAVAELLGRGRGAPVTAAYLDHDAPRLADLDVHEGTAVLPLLLSTGYHARVDVPAAVRSLPVAVRLLDPLGHPPQVLDAAVRDADADDVVLVAAGTSDVGERAAFTTGAHEASNRLGVRVRAAFATGTGARPADVAHQGAVVVPWLLAPGRLLDEVRAQARAAGVPVAGGALLAHPAMHAHLAWRIGRSPR